MDFESREKKIVLKEEDSRGSNFYTWLPHSDHIVVVKKILAISKNWGLTEVDLDKIKKLALFPEAKIKVEYGIEIMAQSIGLVGAAQSKHHIVDRVEAKEAYITGISKIDFLGNEHIEEKAPLFVEVKEKRCVGPFRLCNARLFSKKGTTEKTIMQAALKTFSVG